MVWTWGNILSSSLIFQPRIVIWRNSSSLVTNVFTTRVEATTRVKWGAVYQVSEVLLASQDEIARIRKRKRGRNMLNRSGNTTDNLCFRYRFRDVFSRFRCCVYNGTGPLFVHVSVKFQLKETNVSAIVISGLHLRKHKKTLRKHVFSMFPSRKLILQLSR